MVKKNKIMKSKLNLKELRNIVEEVFSVNLETRSRQNVFIAARFTYYHLTIINCRYYSLDRIGKSIGYDHATVLNGRNQFYGLMKIHPEYQKLVDQCELMCKSKNSKSIDQRIFDIRKEIKTLEDELIRLSVENLVA